MTAIFWLIDQSSRIALANFQWDTHGEILDEIAPWLQPAHDKALEPEPDPELVHEMQQKPNPGKRRVK